MTALAERPVQTEHGMRCTEAGCGRLADPEDVVCPGHAVPAPPGVVLGRTVPRLWTRPLRELTPATSLGYQAIRFAEDVLGVSLLPWQRWWLVHALELLPDGTFRFSTVLTLVARQNGKTVLLKIVALWFLYLGHGRLVLGAAQALNIARESWQGAVELASAVPDLAAEIPARGGLRFANGEQCLTLSNGARYMITAATRGAGRGLSVDLLILDELREQRDTVAWAALGNTTMARPNSLTVGISNQGDDQSIVLNTLRTAALAGTDPALMLTEWSAPDGCELDDMAAAAQANPGLGRGTTTEAKLRTMRATTSANDFRTENLCQRVDVLDAAIDPLAWRACADQVGSLAPLRTRLALCVDVAPDGQHVTLAGAGVHPDGLVRVEILGAWSSTDAAAEALPALFAAVKPAAVGWYSSGPGAVLRPTMEAVRVPGPRKVGRGAPPDPEPAVELTGTTVTTACQSLDDLAVTRRLVHPADPLLDAHVTGAQRLYSGDGWRFVRRGAGHVDAAYATAGAAHLARLLPPAPPPPRSKVY